MLIFDKAKEGYEVVNLKQYDCINPLDFEFYNNGLPISLDEYEVQFHVMKEDKTFLIQTENITKSSNKLSILLDKEATSCNGNTSCQIVLIKNNRRDTTFTFYMNVKNDVLSLAESNTVIEILDYLVTNVEIAREVASSLDTSIANGNVEVIRKDVNKSIFNVENVGIINDLVNDQSSKLEEAVSICRANKFKLFIPEDLNICIGKTVDMTGISLDLRGNIRVISQSPIIGLLVGTKNSNSTYPIKININYVWPVPPTTRTLTSDDISVRLVGTKNGDVKIGQVYTFSIYADNETGQTSTSYTTFNIGKVNYLNIKALGSGWITQCLFTTLRVVDELYIGGDYNINNLRFNYVCSEGALINIDKGSRNKFIDVRSEDTTVNGTKISARIRFGINTMKNIVFDNFGDSKFQRGSYITVVEDLGFDNMVINDYMNTLQEVQLLSLIPKATIDTSYCEYDSSVVPNIADFTINSTNFTVNTAWKTIASITVDTAGLKRFKIDSDNSRLRFWVQAYDANGVVLEDAKTETNPSPKYVFCPEFVSGNAWWNDGTKEYQNQVNKAGTEISWSKEVRKIRIQVVNGNLSSSSFGYISLSVFSDKNSTTIAENLRVKLRGKIK